MTLRLNTSSMRARYLAGVSSSLRSGSTTASLCICKELFLDALEPGEAGVRAPCKLFEFCRMRLSPRRSPKLLRPVDDEVRVVPGNGRSLTEFLPIELAVEDLPLMPRCIRVGDDWPEFCEPGRNSAVAGEPAVFTVRFGPSDAWGTGVVLSGPVASRGSSGGGLEGTRKGLEAAAGMDFPFDCCR